MKNFIMSEMFDGILLATIISVVSFKLKFLTKSGAVGTFILAVIIYTVGGWKTTFPILSFFILSSLLSKIGKKQKLESQSVFEKTGQRDIIQVFANGGIATIITLVMFAMNEINQFYIYYLSTIAAVTADTWGTEIGILSKKQPRLITTLKITVVRTSGAVSLYGLLGGIIGAGVIAIVGNYFQPLTYFEIIGIVISGFIASLVDSILGATIQSQYRCSICNKITERKIHCENNTTLISGIPFINNDFVNILCAVAGVVVSIIYFLF